MDKSDFGRLFIRKNIDRADEDVQVTLATVSLRNVFNRITGPIGNDQTQGGGPGDPPAKGSEFNITFTFGLVAGVNIGDYLSGEVRVWTFGEVGSKTDFDDEEWNDSKITSEHSISGGFGSLTFGRGFEHRIGHRDYGGFYDTHPKDIYTSWGNTTKVDRVTGEQKSETKTVIFGLGLGIFSFEITKDPR